MDPVHILMDPVHGPGPRRGSMDQGVHILYFPMIWLEFGLGGFAQSFFLSLERKIFVSLIYGVSGCKTLKEQ